MAGLTLLLLLWVEQLLLLPTAAFPQVDNTAACRIFGKCSKPEDQCLAGEKFNPESKLCEANTVRTAGDGEEPQQACVNITSATREDELNLDLRTIKDCNTNKTCEDYSDLGFFCVNPWHCKKGLVITDGSGLIDLRTDDSDPDCCTSPAGILDLSDKKCKKAAGNQPIQVCCKGPNVRVKPCTITSKCRTSPPVVADTSGAASPVPAPVSYAECGRVVTNFTLRITGLPDVRSVGGSYTQPGEFPHMCLVFRTVDGQKTYVAGASLIAPNKVLSAAHKFYVKNGKNNQDLRNDKNIFVRCGEHNVKLKAEFLEYQESRVEEMLFAPEYDEKRVYHNLVILKTKENFVYQAHISPVCLPSPGEQFDSYTDCWSTGWGSETFPDVNTPTFYSDDLRKVKLPMVSNKNCFQQLKAHERFVNDPKFVKLHDSWICAGGFQKDVDTCKGDGGSPHICKKDGKWVQVGAVNWGIKCGEQVPGVYSSVAADMCWVDWVMSCIPLSSEFLNLELADKVDLRQTDNTVSSANKLTEKDCGKWMDDHPALAQKCRVVYDSRAASRPDVRTLEVDQDERTIDRK